MLLFIMLSSEPRHQPVFCSRSDLFMLCTLNHLYPCLTTPKAITSPGKYYYDSHYFLNRSTPPSMGNSMRPNHPMRLYVPLMSRWKAKKDAEAIYAMQKYARQCLSRSYYRVMMSENPSTHWPQEPDTPAMLYPRGGIRVCPDPPFGLPKTPDRLPRLVRISMPSIPSPARR